MSAASACPSYYETTTDEAYLDSSIAAASWEEASPFHQDRFASAASKENDDVAAFAGADAIGDAVASLLRCRCRSYEIDGVNRRSRCCLDRLTTIMGTMAR